MSMTALIKRSVRNSDIKDLCLLRKNIFIYFFKYQYTIQNRTEKTKSRSYARKCNAKARYFAVQGSFSTGSEEKDKFSKVEIFWSVDVPTFEKESKYFTSSTGGKLEYLVYI